MAVKEAVVQPEVAVRPKAPEARDRLERLLDEGTLTALHADPAEGIITARGRIDGVKVVAYCTDATKRGGAIGHAAAEHIVEAIDAAVRDRCPVVGLWHSAGAKLTEGIQSMDGVGRMFAAMTRASGRVPQISVVLGPAAGAAAYGPALTDVVIMAPAGRLFITGPDVVRSVTGEQIDMEGLGGTEAHGRRSGVAHIVAESEDDALGRARRLVGLLQRPGHFALDGLREPVDLAALLPDRSRRAYDVRPLVRAILDGPDEFEELQPKWAAAMVTGFGRLGGRTVGVLANNPLRRGGCLDSLTAEKAARFVRMSDSFGVPLLVVVDVPGYLPGVKEEWDGVVRRGAKLLYAFAESVVPRVTLVTRKSYGGAYIAMNSRSLGASAVLAWPQAEVAVMGAEAAVRVLHRKALAAAEGPAQAEVLARLMAEHERTSGGVARGVALGLVDEVIDPATTRLRVAEALAGAPAGRGHHGNIPL
ncbi:carboxyl transferase domain-containing protein [Dactylosporangium sp. NPDC051485]|uniref:acyl-CoA carboxylase subunit beta n=1 Tax=Dactylosporangium sp. NPDC051485 TaxID=3154846 RepID=UPI00341E12FA